MDLCSKCNLWKIEKTKNGLCLICHAKMIRTRVAVAIILFLGWCLVIYVTYKQ